MGAVLVMFVVAYVLWVVAEARRPDPPQPKRKAMLRGTCEDCGGYVGFTHHGECERCGSSSVVLLTWSGPEWSSVLAASHEEPLVPQRVKP